MGQAQTKNKKNKNKEVHKFESKEEYFLKNGRILAEKQLFLTRGREIVGQIRILSADEIKNATNNYDPNLICARTCEVNAYKGTLDDRLVFIKTPNELDQNPQLVNILLNEVSILMVMCHDNLIKVYGVCLDTYTPMMAYEYASSKQLHTCLHGDDVVLLNPMNWRCRLKVASGVAYALSYMHNALSKLVVHRDVKSFFVAIDSSFHAKLASVGYAICITPGKKDKRWPVHGTPGYIDPEYVETQEVTDKCDVYSFGVLMLELLTSRDPVEMARCGKDLVFEFVSETERNGYKAMIDMRVLEDHNIVEIQRFALLALKCMAKKGDDRPTMINVVEELWRIRDH